MVDLGCIRGFSPTEKTSEDTVYSTKTNSQLSDIRPIIMSVDNDAYSSQHQTTSIADVINKDHVEQMINLQIEIISKLDKTSETLVNCNAIAKTKLAAFNKTFKKSTQQIIDIKKDVEAIHRRIRNLKAKIVVEYPDSVRNVETKLAEEPGVSGESSSDRG